MEKLHACEIHSPQVVQMHLVSTFPCLAGLIYGPYQPGGIGLKRAGTTLEMLAKMLL